MSALLKPAATGFTSIPVKLFKSRHDLWCAFLAHRSDLPEGESGKWKVSKFTVERQDVGLSNLRSIIAGAAYRQVMPGSYTRLTYGGGVVMSDTDAEKYEHRPALAATGNVLVTGLGMGMVMPFLLCNPAVTAVTVIEKSPDVIALSAAHFAHPKLTVIQADAHEWRPPKGTVYDFCWHDIWPELCVDNLKEMASLTRKFARFGKPVQDCWGRDFLRRERRRNSRRWW